MLGLCSLLQGRHPVCSEKHDLSSYVSPLTERWGHVGLPLSARLSLANTRRWPKLVQCWPTVCDAGSALNQQWFNASCLLGLSLSVCAGSLLCYESVSDDPFLSRFSMVQASNMRRWSNGGLMLAHRLGRWANISLVLGYHVVFGAALNVGRRHRRRANINPALVQSIVPILYRQHAGKAEWSTD